MPLNRPPKTPRPWPVPRVATPPAASVRSRWEEGAPTPWAEPWDEQSGTGTRTVPAGAPASRGTALPGGGARRLRWTFCVEAPGAHEVLLWANRLSDETDLSTTALERVEGTDLWAGSFVMPDDWVASYCFLVSEAPEGAPWLVGDQVQLRHALDRGSRDLRNPVTCRNRAGVLQSVVHGPGAPHGWRPEDLPASGETTGWSVREVTLQGRGVRVLEPTGGGAQDPLLPTLVVLDGEVWERYHGLPGTVARLVREGRLRPQRLVLVDSGGRESRWADMGGSGQDFVAWACDDLLPAVLPEGVAPDLVSVVGQSLGGLSALRAALVRPDVVGWALSQSASTWVEDLGECAGQWTVGPGRGGVHAAVGAQEWVLTPGHLSLCAALNDPTTRADRPAVELVLHQGGHDYAWWRHALVAALEWQERVRRDSGR